MVAAVPPQPPLPVPLVEEEEEEEEVWAPVRVMEEDGSDGDDSESLHLCVNHV